MADPVRITSGSVSPLAGIQAIHYGIGSPHSPGTIQLAAKVFVVWRGVLRDKLNLIEASMALDAGYIAVIDLP